MARKILTGVSSLLAVFVMALSAEAQGPTNVPTGPTSVSVGAVESTYQSTVTTSGSFYVNLKVWHQGTVKHNSTTFVSTGPGTVNFAKLVTGMDLWGLQVGQTLNYWTKVWLQSNPKMNDIDNWYVPVIQTYNTRRDKPLFDRPRREELCA